MLWRVGQWTATPLQVCMCLPDTGVLDEHKKKQVIDFPADLDLEGIEQH